MKILKHFIRKTVLVACAIAGTLSTSLVFSLPQGENVTSGNATFSNTFTETINGTQFTTLEINQTSNQAIIEYSSFDIGQQEKVEFIQPSANSSVLNRVTGSTSPTEILGHLEANGQVYIVNPAGITFGANSVVDVGALYAAAGNISDSDFNNGIDQFSNLSGTITNNGSIGAKDVFLIGKHLINSDEIRLTDTNGLVVLSAAGEEDTVLIGETNSSIYVEMRPNANRTTTATTPTGIDNRGTIDANGGSLVLLGAGDLYSIAIRNSGILRSTGGNITAIASKSQTRITEGGTLNSGSSGNGSAISLAGTIQVGVSDIEDQGPVAIISKDTSTGATGGDIKVLAEVINLKNTAEINASGHSGGGTIYIGGGQSGNDSGIPNATNTDIENGVEIIADATASGDGGRIILFAEDTLEFQGEASVQGGSSSGDGGFIEVSGKTTLVTKSSSEGGINSQLKLNAPNGTNGTLQIDPTNIEVLDEITNEDGLSNGVGDNGEIDSDQLASPWQVTPAELEAVEGNIILIADNTITFSSDLNLTAAEASLTAQAGNAIIVQAPIATNNGTIRLTGSILLTSDVSLISGSADITLIGSVDSSLGINSLNLQSTGNTVITGNIGSDSPLGSLITNSGGTTNLSGNISTINSSTTSKDTTGDIILGDSITLLTNSVINSGTGKVTFKGSLDAGDNTVELGTNGTVTFEGDTTIPVLNGGLQEVGGDEVVIGSNATFTGEINLRTGNDVLSVRDQASISSSVTGGEGDDTLDYSSSNSDVSIDLNTYTEFETLRGGNGNDTIVGTEGDTAWVIDGVNAGSINTNIRFNSIENLQSGSGNDTFTLGSAALSGNISGGDGNDSLTGGDTTNTWQLTSGDSGIVAGVTFTQIETLNGGNSSDTLVGVNDNNTWTMSSANAGDLNGFFSFTSMEILRGNTSTDTLVSSNLANTWTMSGAKSGTLALTQAGGSLAFYEMETLQGGTDADTLISPDNGATTWTLTADGTGTLATGTSSPVSFSQMENLGGGNGNDTFILTANTSLANPTISGGGGSDTVVGTDQDTTWQATSPNSVDVAGISFSQVENLRGGSGTDNLQGANTATNWVVDGTNTGSISNMRFSSMENLKGGTSTDTFTVTPIGNITGTIDGGFDSSNTNTTEGDLDILSLQNEEIVINVSDTGTGDQKQGTLTSDVITMTFDNILARIDPLPDPHQEVSPALNSNWEFIRLSSLASIQSANDAAGPKFGEIKKGLKPLKNNIFYQGLKLEFIDELKKGTFNGWEIDFNNSSLTRNSENSLELEFSHGRFDPIGWTNSLDDKKTFSQLQLVSTFITF